LQIGWQLCGRSRAVLNAPLPGSRSRDRGDRGDRGQRRSARWPFAPRAPPPRLPRQGPPLPRQGSATARQVRHRSPGPPPLARPAAARQARRRSPGPPRLARPAALVRPARAPLARATTSLPLMGRVQERLEHGLTLCCGRLPGVCALQEAEARWVVWTFAQVNDHDGWRISDHQMHSR
jgi:hypothetical protein